MIDDKMIFSVEFGKYSTAGINKPMIEDAVGYYLPPEQEKLIERGQMFMVADGYGEEQQGEMASKLAIETITREYFEAIWLDNVEQTLTTAIKRANNAIHRVNLEKGDKGFFACSLTCAVIQENTLYVAYVGNCSAFLFSNNNLERLTDVSTTERNSNLFTSIHESKINNPTAYRLGESDEVQIGLVKRQIQIKDVVFICTENISATIPEQEISLTISTTDPVQACESMVKFTAKKYPEQDASAVVIRVKGVRRLSLGEQKPIAPEVSDAEAKERQIVIKGVRYRQKLDNEEMSNSDQDGLKQFSLDREISRRVFKRSTSPTKSRVSLFRVISTILVILIVILAIFYAIKYGPDYWRSLKTPQTVQTIIPDSADSISTDEFQQKSETTDTVLTQTVTPIPDIAKDTTKQTAALDTTQIVSETPITPAAISFRIVVINGSGKKVNLENFNNELKNLSSTDQILTVRSKYRIKQSKILWRKSTDLRKLNVLTDQILQHQNLLKKLFDVDAKTFPLDFTLVIGSDFKIPNIPDNYIDKAEGIDDYFMEILNGSKMSGLARKLSNMLHYQGFDDKRLVIVDYRNADKLNYPKTFIKCEASKNDIAEKMAARFGLPKLVTNNQLFDIKIILGGDIRIK